MLLLKASFFACGLLDKGSSNINHTFYIKNILITDVFQKVISIFLYILSLHFYTLFPSLRQLHYAPFKKSLWFLIQLSLHKKFNFIVTLNIFPPRVSFSGPDRCKSLSARSGI